ncbi:MAG TPA: hypothetical protein VF039_06605 [Longimicrobiales bacterium]
MRRFAPALCAALFAGCAANGSRAAELPAGCAELRSIEEQAGLERVRARRAFEGARELERYFATSERPSSETQLRSNALRVRGDQHVKDADSLQAEGARRRALLVSEGIACEQ